MQDWQPMPVSTRLATIADGPNVEQDLKLCSCAR